MDIWIILRRWGCENCRTLDISCSWGWQNHSDPPLVIDPLMNIRRRRFILIHLTGVILLWLPSILNINELVFVLLHRGGSRIVESFLFFIWARGNIHHWFLRHKWRRGCVVQSCSRRLECDWNMPGSYPLSVHLYLIWLILILINGTIWPDVETVSHCVGHSYLMRWIFITIIVIWGRLIQWSYNPALQIWFYNWSRMRLLSLCLRHSAIGIGSSKILSKTSCTRYWCLDVSCTCWWYLKPSCLLVLNCPNGRHTPSLESQMRCRLWIYTWVHF